MSKTTRIIYWISTLWLALGMASTGIVQLLALPQEVDNITHLGYPLYLLKILGAWKILGVIAVLIPGFPLVKEWTYAGFFFAMSGATVSRLFAGDPLTAMLPSLLLLALTFISWYLRPASRRLHNQMLAI